MLTFGPADPAQDSVEGTSLVKTVGAHNLLAEAVHIAYYEHYPLRLSADCIWFTVLQGLCFHLQCNPEISERCFPERKPASDSNVRINRKKTRSRGASSAPKSRRKSRNTPTPTQLKEFDAHESSSENLKYNYKRYISDFYEEINCFLGDELAELSSHVYSTTNSASRLAFKVGLMGPMRHFFKFKPRKGCGIPFIELTGNQQDWAKLRENVKSIFENNELEFDWWKTELMPIIDEFLQAAFGRPNLPFWASMCNIFSQSGSNQPITGWLQALFPYLVKSPSEPSFYQNKNLGAWRVCYDKVVQDGVDGKILFGVEENADFVNDECAEGINLDNIPNGLGKIKFNFVTEREISDRLGQKYLQEIREKMSLVSGMVGVIQYPKTRALEPVFGWGIMRPALN